MKTSKKKGLEYVPDADDGLGFFPAITCQLAGNGARRVRWVVHHRRRQFPTKQEALASAEAELALAFETPALPASPERFLDHLRQRGFPELMDYRVARRGGPPHSARRHLPAGLRRGHRPRSGPARRPHGDDQPPARRE